MNITTSALLLTDITNGGCDEIDERNVIRARSIRRWKRHSGTESPARPLVRRADQIEGFVACFDEPSYELDAMP